MTIPAKSAGPGSGFPSLEDAARAADARRKLATKFDKRGPVSLTFSGATRQETISLPKTAVDALNRILAHIAAGRGVSITPRDSEIELDDAALLAGLDPLDFLEKITLLQLPMRSEGKQVFIGTDVFAACLEVIETADARVAGVVDDAPNAVRIADKKLARDLLTHRQWHLVDRLAHDLRKTGRIPLSDIYPLDCYFGAAPLIGDRPPSWPPLPGKSNGKG
jgi:hypothetical protein